MPDNDNTLIPLIINGLSLGLDNTKKLGLTPLYIDIAISKNKDLPILNDKLEDQILAGISTHAPSDIKQILDVIDKLQKESKKSKKKIDYDEEDNEEGKTEEKEKETPPDNQTTNQPEQQSSDNNSEEGKNVEDLFKGKFESLQYDVTSKLWKAVVEDLSLITEENESAGIPKCSEMEYKFLSNTSLITNTDKYLNEYKAFRQRVMSSAKPSNIAIIITSAVIGGNCLQDEEKPDNVSMYENAIFLVSRQYNINGKLVDSLYGKFSVNDTTLDEFQRLKYKALGFILSIFDPSDDYSSNKFTLDGFLRTLSEISKEFRGKMNTSGVEFKLPTVKGTSLTELFRMLVGQKVVASIASVYSRGRDMEGSSVETESPVVEFVGNQLLKTLQNMGIDFGEREITEDIYIWDGNKLSTSDPKFNPYAKQQLQIQKVNVSPFAQLVLQKINKNIRERDVIRKLTETQTLILHIPNYKMLSYAFVLSPESYKDIMPTLVTQMDKDDISNTNLFLERVVTPSYRNQPLLKNRQPIEVELEESKLTLTTYGDVLNYCLKKTLQIHGGIMIAFYGENVPDVILHIKIPGLNDSIIEKLTTQILSLIEKHFDNVVSIDVFKSLKSLVTSAFSLIANRDDQFGQIARIFKNAFDDIMFIANMVNKLMIQPSKLAVQATSQIAGKAKTQAQKQTQQSTQKQPTSENPKTETNPKNA